MRFTNRITFTKAGSILTKPQGFVPEKITRSQQAGGGQPRLRERSDTRKRWPFLDDPNTPVELKALITQRITRWHEYTKLYQQLRDCTDVEACAYVAGKLLDAYLDNQAITRELDYYQKNGKVLGRHPMFRHFQQLARLRSSSVKDLIREQQKTKDNIWRIKSEMKKGDKPHLDEKRRQKLQEYEMKLQEINNLLGDE